MRDSQKTAPEARAAPATMIGRVPMRLNSVEAMPEEIATPKVTGRYAEPPLISLHVEGEEEEHRIEAGHRDHLRRVGGCQAADAEDRQRYERITVAVFVEQERCEQHTGRG
jgi:hypothetical protein